MVKDHLVLTVRSIFLSRARVLARGVENTRPPRLIFGLSDVWEALAGGGWEAGAGGV